MNLKVKFLQRISRLGLLALVMLAYLWFVNLLKVMFQLSDLTYQMRKLTNLTVENPTFKISQMTKFPNVMHQEIQSHNRFSELSNADVISICVPTPLRKTKDPDMSYVVAAVNSIAEHVRNGQLIILESTTYPGTTEELLQPIFESKGFVIGESIFLAFSPERVDPGNETYTTKNTPKVVGGVTPSCTTLACDTYSHAIDCTVPVSSPRAAELVKLYENTFRSVNIAMANEMALIANKLNIDVWEVIDAAATKPFGFMPFYPGPGLGGHCIPIDPSYLSWKMKSLNYDARFIALAEQINTSMPNYVVKKVGVALNSIKKAINGSKILILGVAYKPNINDVRERERGIPQHLMSLNNFNALALRLFTMMILFHQFQCQKILVSIRLTYLQLISTILIVLQS